MNRSTARTVALALFCLLALVVAAATLPSMQSGGSGDGGGFSGGSADDASELPGGETNRSGGSGGGGGSLPTLCVEPLLSAGGAGAVVLTALGAAYLTSRRFGLGVTLVFVLGLSPLLVLLALVLTGGCTGGGAAIPTGGEFNATPDGGSGDGLFGGGGGGTDGDVPTTAVPSLALLSVLLLAIGGAFAALFYSDGGGEPSEQESDERPADEERRSEIGRAAGRAADRIEDSEEFENEVYRAWREMTDALPVDRPASSTPGEFAAAARDVGVDNDDVAELTELFEAVRYGGREATGDREERAVAALRRIEAAYGGDDDG